MDTGIGEKQFRGMFDDRAIVVADVPSGSARDLAAKVNKPAGLGDATLRTRAEFVALFDGIRQDSGDDGDVLRLTDKRGAPTVAGRLVDTYRRASIGLRSSSRGRCTRSRSPTGRPTTCGPRSRSWRAGTRGSPVARRSRRSAGVPPPDDAGVLFTTPTFSLVNSGNKTKFAPKRSWKVDVDPGDDDDKLVGMPRLNLKSMYNDPSQMREAIAWALFRQAGVPAARHTYARVAINGAYQGLYSLIEQVDQGFLREQVRREQPRQPVQGVLRRRRLRDARTPGRRGTATTAGGSTSPGTTTRT